MPVVVESGRHHREPSPERGDVAVGEYRVGTEGAAVVLQRRTAGSASGAAPAAMGDQDFVVPLRLRSPPIPRLPRLVQGEDLVLITILVTDLLPDDERDANTLIRGRRRDVGWRARWVVWLKVVLGRVGRSVEIGVRRGLVALHVDRVAGTLPRLQLRTR